MLLIGLNLYKGREPKISYTIGSLAAELKRREIAFDIADFDLNQSKEGQELDFIFEGLQEFDLQSYKLIGISVFSWSEFLINPLINRLKEINPLVKIVLGGPQITYATDQQLQQFYPNADYFIKGYGERALADLAEGKIDKTIIVSSFDPHGLLSPYQAKIIELRQDQAMIRFETKRGCPYRCGFCAHFDKNFKRRVYEFDMERIEYDLEVIKKYNVKRVNVLDPVFNMKNHKQVLKTIAQKGIPSQFTFQTRFELMDEETISLCQKINCHLEFGLQTVVPLEEKIINRPNNLPKVKKVMQMVNFSGLSYEVSIIYGLPGQTYETFLQTVDFLQTNGCYNIVMFPLGLLRGTPLDLMKDYYSMKTMTLSRFDTPVVVSSFSFDYSEWEKMHVFAQNYKTQLLCQKSL